MKITLVLFIIFSVKLFSQSDLEKQLKQASATEKIDIYEELINTTCDKNAKKCLSYLKELDKLSEVQKNSDAKIFVYNTYAIYYYNIKNYAKSIKYFEKELNLRVSSGKIVDLAEAYYNLGSTCYKMGKYSKAKQNFELSLKNAGNNKDLILTNYNALIKTYEKIAKYKSANTYLKKYIDLKTGYYEETVGIYEQKYINEKKDKEAKIQELDYTSKKLENKETQLGITKEVLDSTKDDLEEVRVTVEELEIDTLKKKLRIADLNIKTKLGDIEIKQNEKIISQQKQITYILIIGISSVMVLAAFLLLLFLNKKKMNLALTQSKKEIELKNSHITKSITYASKIQEALLPNESYFEQNFENHFIIFKPRDIVSGDFYFFQKVNDYVLFAAVDCTGHGVPGAFMSMLGISFLNEIVRKQEVTSSSQVLDSMRAEVKRTLNQTGKKGEQKDGMDMVLCAYNTKTAELQFAGAHNSLILIRNKELIEYKGDRMPVGIHRKEKEFTNHKIKIEKGDKIYLYSDGFQDQMGGEDDRKYKSRRFKTFLLETSSYNMLEQKQKIEKEFVEWKKEFNQIDDIVILGIEF